ncbi:unnamed protein product [Trifolium pratense]|uniref:Uncharacterized protein n=1 Tax=Trifolium pratense TaxID=57577 RepID=A0ACB0LW59_TRIPR|nr:unnamed protein product [Trifolium pratense]
MERPGVDDLHFKRLSQVEIGGLIKPFAEDEVKQAVWDCDSYKSPGPDGINFGFVKDFWADLRGDVMRFLLDFHRNGRLTKGINSTFIALIPKTDSPQRLNDFRPISLVGSLYKILAKVLANRLRQVMGSVISEAQTAFVKNRQILDGILIANEIVDEARKSKKDLMLFKVDFEKAYDSVDWGYLDDVMGRMSFPTLWRKWIRECVGTATTFVLVNGSPTDEFPLRRGLRQGDPLSPFLFLLAAEGLNVLMEAMVARNLFTGKISWVSWKSICLRKEFGGLGVRQLREFNLALLGKWCWRLLVDREGLWYRVLVARYGVEGGRLREGGQRGSVWWREVARIREGVGESEGSWFGEHVLRRVGNGSDTLFWTDPWVDGISMRERFGRLFVLAETKSHTVTEMFVLGWGRGGEAWKWRRQLRAWEEELLGECQSLLLDISLQDQTSDRWQWSPDPDTGYTVRGAYQILTSQDSVTLHDAENLIWHPQVPLKVSIFAWRLLRDRLPTRANLVNRGVLSSSADTCVFGCGVAESAHHLFLSCSFAGSLWDLVREWVDISPVVSTTLRDHFAQFTASAGVSRARRSFMQLLWLVCAWVIWTERNHRLFKGSIDTPHLLLDKIKLLSFSLD